ncbi:MAG: FAD-dependent oxidoreductase [Desulfosarcina sp.]|nr:FAD-dependent oxidoreductase [Desulfosarcina sp.]MBC2742705.1 FAD-dependent oxidoreductase [Desulfosarcina sp.]MBC2765615.1 FAD-dependent oxidoreductase [Desulfosarcina sp.]
MYRYLFSPITINRLEIKNRIAYPSLGLLFSYDSKLNDRYTHFFRERAKGGAGIVTVGPVGVDFLGSGILALSIARDEAIPDFTKVTGIIKEEGARAWIQLFHAGAYSHPFLIDGKDPIAPSAVYSKYAKTTPREMTIEDIHQVQEAFAAAARRAVVAGFDGVEIIGSAGYLITQFLSPLKNHRTDQYGGSFENRLRFPTELIAKVRDAVGPDVPLTIRMAGNDFVPGSNTDTDTPKIAAAYQAAGVDAINVTGGWHESRVPQLPMELPRTAYAFLARNIKNAVTVPVMASNRIASPDDAERILRDGYADMVNLGRVLIADPQWPVKAFEGRTSEIRPCVACSQGCTDEIFSGRPVFCVGNPRAGFEAERKIIPTDSPKRIMVVGAGAAGLEAAVTAAERGHRVEIFEKDSDLGGQLWIAGAPPHKRELLEFIRYYRAMVNRCQIPLHLNTTVDINLIREKAPGHVIVAEGARALIPPIPGADSPEVLNAWQVLKDNPMLGKRVAIIGGGAVGLETALFVAAKGTLTPEVLHFLMAYDAMPPERLKALMFAGTSSVTVFEMLDKAGKDVGKSTRWILMDRLNRYGVTIKTGTRVLSIDNGKITWEQDGENRSDRFDTVILASGSLSEQRLAKAMADAGIPHTVVGDGIKPGKLNDAIHGGFLAALGL